MSKKEKGISPLIAVILLVVVAVVIIGIILSWGKNLTNTSVNEVSTFEDNYGIDTVTMLKAKNFNNSKLVIENLKSKSAVTITGYKIISDLTNDLLNTVVNLPESVTIESGTSGSIDIVQPSETKFDVQLITDQNMYIDVQNIPNFQKQTFTSTFGETAYTDYGKSVQQTTDGGYIVAGYTSSYGDGNSDLWLLKTDSFGDLDWNYTFGGDSEHDYGYSVQQTTDGGYIVTGVSSAGAGSDVWLLKTDSSGTLDWNQNFGGAGYEVGYSVQQTTDGGYIIVGYTVSYGDGTDAYLVKTDSSGTLDWNQNFGASGYEAGKSIKQTTDGGYIIVGETSSYGAGGSDIWLVKTDSSGTLDWNQVFGSSSNDSGNSVQQTIDGGYIVVGSTGYGDEGATNIWLLKTDSSGTLDWNQTFGGAGYDYGRSVQQTSDGGYIITGDYSESGGTKLWLIKTNSSGSQLWALDSDLNYSGYSVQQTTDGGYIVTGTSTSSESTPCGSGTCYYHDLLLLKVDSAGNIS